jgi:hypothetical protein
LNIYVILTYFAVGLSLFVPGFLGSNKNQHYFRAALFILACAGIRPGILGEEFGAIGVFLFLPFVVVFLANGKPIPNSIKMTALFVLIFFAWDSASSGFVEGFISIQAAAVGVIVLFASYGFSQSSIQLKAFFRLGLVVVIWQVVASFATFLLPATFPLSNNLQLGRQWIYYTNSLGGIFAGNSFEFSSTLKLIGITGLDNLPRLTGPWGEPGIIALFAVFLSAIHLFQNLKWSPKAQIPIVLLVLATQSFGGIVVYVIVTVSALFLVNSDSVSKIQLNLRRLFIVGFAGVTLQIALAQSASKFSSSTLSLTDRSGERGILQLVSQIVGNPLGTQASGGINLLQASVNSGLPTLIVGLLIYLVIPLRAISRNRFSPLFLVPLLSVLFVQPPALPIWLAFLGITLGSLSTAERTEDRPLAGPNSN